MTNQEWLFGQHPDYVANFMASFDTCAMCQIKEFCREQDPRGQFHCKTIIKLWLFEERKGGGEDG